jgi:hypothetical protein
MVLIGSKIGLETRLLAHKLVFYFIENLSRCKLYLINFHFLNRMAHILVIYYMDMLIPGVVLLQV